MGKNRKMRALAALTACLGFSSFVSAAPITTLFNTGIATNDANGNPSSVVADAANDPHYTVTSTPAGPNAPFPAVVVDQNGGAYPFTDGMGNTVWQADSSLSKWISIHAQENTTEASSTATFYTYNTTFDLTGFVPSTAHITGKFYEDDIVQDILINSTSLGVFQGGGNASGAGVSFNVSSGFVAGVNTLTFIIENYPTGISPNPTGLDVQMTGTATALPEPASLAFGGITAGLMMLRKKHGAKK
jgi:hypothetical protein